jgi:hypothetical protein
MTVCHLTADVDLRGAIRVAADVLGADMCWFYRGAFHFKINSGDHTVAISRDSANRIRVDLCYLTVAVGTKWTSSRDRARLASLIREGIEELTAVGV